MTETVTFADLIRRVRAGDGQAAEEVVRRYEPAIRLEVRMRLSDPRLRRVFDSMDICQSVLASFFLRAAVGQYNLDEPGQLLRLLVAMTRNKVAFQARKQRALRRDHRRQEGFEQDGLGEAAVSSGPSPSRVVCGKELLLEFRQRLSDEERALADRRALGQEWAAIAAELGGTPQARRKQLARGLDRVSRELGLEEAEPPS